MSLVDDKKDEDHIVFGEKDAKIGVIFYQGAKVEAEAYSYLEKLLQKMDICSHAEVTIKFSDTWNQ